MPCLLSKDVNVTMAYAHLQLEIGSELPNDVGSAQTGGLPKSFTT